MQTEVKACADTAKLGTEMNERLQKQVQELKDERESLRERLDELEVTKDEAQRASNSKVELLQKEKDILLAKLKKLQKAAAKLPQLEIENNHLRESMEKTKIVGSDSGKNEREAILKDNLLRTMQQQEDLDRRLDQEREEKLRLKKELREKQDAGLMDSTDFSKQIDR